MERLRRHRWPVVLAVTAVLLGGSLPAAASSADVRVDTGSPLGPFSQNKQNEPALAVDANHPNILVSGSNDEIDIEACAAGNPTTCPLHEGVGVSGVYFSFDSGASWTQPTYTGLTARDCLGPAACHPHAGPIGTLPWYFENGLVSDGDPGIAFGPRPGSDGRFSWTNGSRLYYANLTSNLSATGPAFKGAEAVAVSRTDAVATAAAGGAAGKNAWMPPVIVSRQNATLFSDKEQIWADNASSSPFFGHAYICYAAFRSNSQGLAFPQPLMISASGDGGSTWTQHQATPANTNVVNSAGRTGCTVRTDSHGVVYALYYNFANGMPGHGAQFVVRSFDGGATWERPQLVEPATDTCNYFDPIVRRCMEDGVAGSRDDLSPAPSVDIANGAPTGSGATDEILLTWVDGGAGLNHEKVMFTYSTSHGATWATPADLTRGGDRGYYSAVAIKPNGSAAYLNYLSWETPFRSTTSNPRILQAVVLRSNIGSGGTPSSWSEVDRGNPGDARGSTQNNLVGEFLGDYVYAVATATYGAAVWTDVRNAADCPAIDAWRQSNETNGSVTTTPPAVNSACPLAFGNSDIYGFTTP